MRRAVLLSILTFVATSAFAGAPPWVQELAKKPVPAYAPEIGGVVLLDDITTTVTGKGEIRTARRIAYRILGTSGRDLGIIGIHTDAETKLTSLRGWSIAASGQEYQVNQRDAVETAAYDGGLYSDNKLIALRAPASDPGSVVAFEYEQRERPYSLQSAWSLHREIPVLTKRYTLVLPEGWTYDAKWFNAPPVAAQTSGQTTRWEMTSLPELKDEPRMPSARAIGAHVGINFVPPDERLAGKAHRTWDDVAKMYSGMVASRGGSTPALQAKARELTAGKETPLAKLTALAEFAQRDVRYVAIEIGIGGLQPHLAGDIFANRYGDCKDKVNVLAALLRESGFESYFVLASTYRGWVDPEFATVSAFNHAIIAIKLPAGIDTKTLHAVVNDAKGGKLLLFDPTSESTPFGSLPSYLQQNQVLLVDGTRGQLIDIRPHAPEASRLAVSAKLRLDSVGTLAGNVLEVRSGAMAGEMRQYLASLDEAGRRKYYESRLASHLTGTTALTNFTVEPPNAAGELVVHYTIYSPAYAKKAGGMLLVRPRVLGTKGEAVLDLSDRHYGYESDGPSIETDDIEIVMPPGTTVTEVPPATHVASSIVKYDSESKFEGNKLSYRREYRVTGIGVSREALPELNKAFSAIARDERSSAIVAQK